MSLQVEWMLGYACAKCRRRAHQSQTLPPTSMPAGLLSLLCKYNRYSITCGQAADVAPAEVKPNLRGHYQLGCFHLFAHRLVTRRSEYWLQTLLLSASNCVFGTVALRPCPSTYTHGLSSETRKYCSKGDLCRFCPDLWHVARRDAMTSLPK